MTALAESHGAESYLPFVRQIASRIARRLPSTVVIDDLVGAGTIGLMDAIARYRPQEGKSFEDYAEYRIRGAILDELRRADPLNRAARDARRKAQEKRRELERELGRPVEDEEVSRALGLEGAEGCERVRRAEACQIVALESEALLGADEDQPGQDELLGQAQRTAAVRRALEGLSKREQAVLNLYYVEDLTQQQIGEVLDVTESRVCQILSQLRQKLRERLAELKE